MKDEGTQEMIKKFYSESDIGNLLDNSFFKNRLESVYQAGLMDRDMVAFAIQAWEPFKEYKIEPLSTEMIKTAELLIAPKNKKKTA